MELNDLQLADTTPFNVSRSHFAIERVPDGVQVRDRGSYVGTIVNQVPIGGHRRVATVPLVVGENEVVAGGPESPFRFRVIVAVTTIDHRPSPRMPRDGNRNACHAAPAALISTTIEQAHSAEKKENADQ